MANSLGYKDKISWETIQNPYIPKGMVISMNQQQQFQAGQLQVLQMLTSIPNNANKNEENQGKQTENRNRKTDVYATLNRTLTDVDRTFQPV